MRLFRRLKPGRFPRPGGPAGAPAEPPAAPSHEELTALVKSLGGWYQRIYLGRGVYTMDAARAYHEEVWARLEPAFPEDLRGASVLDIGCNAGYFSLQVKRRGAGRVLGIDHMGQYLEQAVACARIWDLDIEYRLLDVDQVPALREEFDVVVFAGVLYHLKNPLRAIEDLSAACRDVLLLETEIMANDPRNRVYVRQGPFGKVKLRACRTGIMKFVEGAELNGDLSNWWIPDAECVLGMLRTAGFKYFSAPVYVQENRLLVAASKRDPSLLDVRAVT